MNRLYRLIAKVPNYVRAFGFWRGLQLLFSSESRLLRKHDSLLECRLPGYPNSVFLRNTVSDHAIFWQCLVTQQYRLEKFSQSARVFESYRSKLANNQRPVILDCGGNIGLSSLYLANMFPEATIVVVEPDKENFSLLEKNLAGLGGAVLPVWGAVWSEGGYVNIKNPQAGSSAFQVGKGEVQVENTVPAYTVEDLCRRAGVDSPFIIKIDIEGAQGELFSRNCEWVEDCHLIMIELDDWVLPWQGTSRSFFSCVSQYPFDYILSGETLFCFHDKNIQGAA
ncbi:FkbM family methyltransferase [Ectothiorhodospira marina]|uniref:Methyltransferase, FkbM family n=1 Tax=Ectothiorhodospira marina TaxID=1396821 RepID=A0A1H7IET2_9GAMM|nr:FkbM family methyltransferase [Ectothiorhodospira marina]SEK60362.1 methyltransferase, FkbM family [Ectothiorhodospira marina]